MGVQLFFHVQKHILKS